jgi:hypothetical protein
MGGGGGGNRPEPAPAPVVNASPIGDDLAPELVTADELDEELQKKKKKKDGTSMLQTSGTNTATSASNSGLNIQ